MRILPTLTALALSLSLSAAPKPKTISLDAASGVKPITSGHVVVADHSYTLDRGAGVGFHGDWDLREYKSLKFTVTNPDPKSVICVACILADKNHIGYTRYEKYPKSTLIIKEIAIDPGQTVEVEMKLPCDIPHPEVNDAITGVRNRPYVMAMDVRGYNADLANIRTIKFEGLKFGRSSKNWTVSNISIVPGKRPAAPAWMKLGRDEFFPFIDKYGQFKYTSWPGKIKSDKDLEKARVAEEKDLAKNPGCDGWSKFGGWADGPRYEATGSFRVQKIDGKWWMIDPEGYLFWAHGVVRVTTSCAMTPLDNRRDYFEYLPADEGDPFYKFYTTRDELLYPYYTARGIKDIYDFSSANAYRKYGPEYKDIFADLAHRRLRSWGMNLIANSSDRSICLMDRTAYNERVDLGAPVKGYPVWPVLQGSGGWWPFIDPFDPSFPLCVRAHLEDIRPQLDDPWCIGVFVDNEIAWRDQLNFATLAYKATPDQAAKSVLVGDLCSKYRTIEALNKVWGSSFSSWNDIMLNREDPPAGAKADLEAFTLRIVREYFSIVRSVFKEAAPQKLYMGCRFAGAPEYVVRIAAEYCDVMSYNTYSYDVYGFRLPDGLDVPIMYGEFHFGSTDRGMFHQGQTWANNQEHKGQCYENYVRSALENPCIIGTNWHQFSDQATTGRFDGESFQVGMTDICDTPYPEMVNHIRAIGYSMYEIRMNAK